MNLTLANPKMLMRKLRSRARLTTRGLGLIRSVRTLLLAITLPALRDAVAVITGEVTVCAGPLGCGAKRRKS